MTEFQLEQARPVDLPVPHGDDDLESPRPIQQSPRGRSGERMGQSVPAKSSRMATPPSSWETPGGDPGLQSVQAQQGATVFESSEEVVNSQGTGTNALQQALGESVVDFLAQENARLREELMRMKVRSERSEASGQSWSEVSRSSAVMMSEGYMPQVTPTKPLKTEGVAPSSNATVSIGPPGWSKEASGQRSELRYTPGGTQIPDGPPPEAAYLPPIPPPPSWLEAEWDMYQREEASRRVRLGDVQWEPQLQAGRRKSLSPREARMMWLEREVRTLQTAMHQRQQDALRSEYWKQPVHRWGRTGGEIGFGAQQEIGADGCGYHGVCLDSRAFGSHGVYHEDRAPSIPEVCHEARALSNHQVCHDHRACGSHAVCPDSRAFSDSRLCGDSRAPGISGVCHEDRAPSNQGRAQCDLGGAGEMRQGSGEVHSGEVSGTRGNGGDGRRETQEDGFEDMPRSFPIKLPSLPDPGAKLASLEAGD